MNEFFKFFFSSDNWFYFPQIAQIFTDDAVESWAIWQNSSLFVNP